jgi:hypothetical protein
MILEDGKWRLRSITIGESTGNPPPGKAAGLPQIFETRVSQIHRLQWTKRYPPDITLRNIGERELTFRGGNGKYIQWPEIQRMWFQYRNLVSGRVSEFYWPGYVPCRAKPDSRL